MDRRFIVNEQNEEFLIKITNGQFYVRGCGWYLNKPDKTCVNLIRGDILIPDFSSINDKGEYITNYTAYGIREIIK